MTTTLPARRAAPAPPERARTLFATIVFLVLLGGDVLRNATSFWGWGVVCGVMVVAAAVVVVRHPPRVRSLPRLLVLWLAFAVVSLAWSQYPAASAIGIVATLATTLGAVAVTSALPWPSIVVALGRALRLHVGLSLLFELVVGVFVRQPVCTVYTDCSGDVPDAFFWSRAELFTGGRIQGLQGNSNILAVLALLALVVTAVQLSAAQVTKNAGRVGIAAAVVVLLLTRSATTLVCAVAVALVLLLVTRLRATPVEGRGRVYGVAAALALLAAGLLVLAREPLLALAGRSGDLTGRTDIWAAVLDLGVQHPVVGWGWVSYWIPISEPFIDLAERNGVVYLQAHDAYLDVWFQLGWVGLVLFLLVVAGVLLRAWSWATDRRVLGVRREAAWSALDLLPVLLLALLLVHGLTESRLIVEWGWAIFVIVVVVTRRDAYGWTDRDRPAPRVAAGEGADAR